MKSTQRAFGITIFIMMISLLTSLQAIELDWLHDYEAALKQAKQEKKDVYLFIGADKCRFCDRLKRDTLSDKTLMKRLRKEYIPLYLSRDQHKIPAGFETKGVPRHYFLTDEGKILHQTWGSPDIPGFYDLLDDVDLVKNSPE